MPNTFLIRSVAAGLIACAFAPSAAQAQDDRREESSTPVRRVISIGNYPRVDGLRINFRDRDLELVRGINLTMWKPYDDSFEGRVEGVAIGLPMTGARNIIGLSVAAFGIGTSDDLRGVTVAGLGGGAGGTLSGISIGGIGLGAGDGVRGLAVGGIGVGSGGDARGILFGGVGAGVGGSLRGAALGGVGVGAGGNARGLMVGGIGVGVGGDVRGLMVGGIGVGAGGDVRGVSVAGVGVGSGGTIHGLSIAGVGVGAPRLEGGVLAPLVGAETARAIIIAPILFRTGSDGELVGASLSAVNAVRGYQRGLSIGLVNYAESLFGVQLGLVNIVRDNPSPFRVLPIINIGRDR